MNIVYHFFKISFGKAKHSVEITLHCFKNEKNQDDISRSEIEKK
jgi:hypothetical protein